MGTSAPPVVATVSSCLVPEWSPLTALNASSRTSEERSSTSSLDSTAPYPGADERAFAVLMFLAHYDRATVARLLEQSFDLQLGFEPLVESLLICGFLEELSQEISQVEGTVYHAALAPDFASAVLIFSNVEGPVCAKRVRRGSNNTAETIRVLPGVQVNSSRGESVGFFSSSETFVFYSPQEKGIGLIKIRMEDFEVVKQLTIQNRGRQVMMMKVTEDVKKALLVMHDGSLFLLKLESGDFEMARTPTLPPGMIRDFIQFLKDTFIHFSNDGRTLITGWNREKKELLCIPLNKTNSQGERASNQLLAYPDVAGSSVLWVSEDASRSIVLERHGTGSEVRFHNASNGEGKEMRSTASSLLDETNVPSLVAERIFCMCIAKELQERIPCYELLDQLALKVTEEKVHTWISKFERNIINAVGVDDQPQESLLHYCILQENLDCAQILFDYAAACGMDVNLCWEGGDILGSAVAMDSPNCVKFILQKLTEKCSTVDQTAAVLSVHFDALLKRFAHVIEDYLTNGKLSFVFGEFHVPLTLFERSEHRPVAMSTDALSTWKAASDSEAKDYWIRNSKVFGNELKNSSGVQVKAVSKFICLDEVVYRDNGNIFAQLVDSDISVDVFKCEGVRHLLQWRWHTSFRNSFLLSFLLHIVAAICFSVFAANFGLDDEPLCPEGADDESGCRQESDVYPTKTDSSDLLAARGGLGAAFLLVWFLTFCGMTPTPRVFSCYSVSILCYLVYSRENHSTLTLFLTSIECISFWLSVLFYLQPFRVTGPLISMIRYVLTDTMPFVMLGLLAIIGFGMGFFVLFGTLYHNDREGTGFDSVPRSLVSMFYMAFGEFDSSDATRHSHQKPYLSIWISTLFVVFVFLGGIILLSLLIAILGDTYDRVKLTEEAELIKCRATIVGSGDGWNNVGYKLMRYFYYRDGCQRRQHVEEEMMQHSSGVEVAPRKRCFHYLVLADPLLKEKENTWHGKILALVNLIRSSLRDGEEKSERGRRELSQTLSQIQENQTMQECILRSFAEETKKAMEMLNSRIAAQEMEIRELKKQLEEKTVTPA